MKVLFCGSGWRSIVDRIRGGLPSSATVAIWDRARPLALEVADVDVILPSNGRIDREVIYAAQNLRLIQQPAAGVDGVDRTAARERGIPVCNAPGANTVAVAEATLHLILALARCRPAADIAFRNAELGEPVGHELREKTLGIIGMGRSGTALADIAKALGMKVLGVGSSSNEDEFATLIKSADVISLHCPLNEQTRGLLGRAELEMVKPGAWLINCARGPIVDRAALEAALDSGRLGGAGLDVFWDEPWVPDDPLFHRPNVVTMPHTAGSTVESFSRIASIVCENIRRVAEGLEPFHQVR